MRVSRADFADNLGEMREWLDRPLVRFENEADGARSALGAKLRGFVGCLNRRAARLPATKRDNGIVQVDDAPIAEHRSRVADAAIFTREQRNTLRDAIRRAWDAHEPHRL